MLILKPEEYKISESRISRIIQNGLNRIKKQLSEQKKLYYEKNKKLLQVRVIFNYEKIKVKMYKNILKNNIQWVYKIYLKISFIK